ncbi:MAG: 30S ribosome-binding factor RbfA [Pantoea sp. Brub]|nr:30S ribosome-binding factor RbfA [Pantoea sp. Brub]
MMNKESHRSYKVSHAIQKEIATILKYNIQDPRLYKLTTISGVIMSKDLSYAKIFVTFYIDKIDHHIITHKLKTLKKASGYIRVLLAQNMKLRIVPYLNFFYDNSMMAGNRMFNLNIKT